MFSKSVSLTFIFLCWPTLLVLLKSILCLLPLVLPLLALHLPAQKEAGMKKGGAIHISPLNLPLKMGGGG